MTVDEDAEPALPAQPVFITYAEFGQRFFETAVTRERVEAATAGLAGRKIDFGPTGVGPIGLIKVSAHGTVGRPTVERVDGDLVAFELTVPVDLAMVIEIGIDKNRFTADVVVRIALTARAAEPLLIVIDIEAPTKHNVDVAVKADGLRASLLQTVAGVNSELRKTVAKFVRREIERPEMRKLRVIDVAKALESLNLPR